MPAQRGQTGRMVRLVAVLVALVISAWFGLGVRQAQDVNRATNIIEGSGQPTRAQAQHASALLSGASTLNPDRTVELLRAELALDEGHDATARHILAAVTRAEPENARAWALLARATGSDRVAYYAALIHLRTLVANPYSNH